MMSEWRTSVKWFISATALPADTASAKDETRKKWRRDEPFAVHRFVQQLLAVSRGTGWTDGADSLFGSFDLQFFRYAFDNLIELAWAASLVLVILVLILNIVSRAIGQKKV